MSDVLALPAVRMSCAIVFGLPLLSVSTHNMKQNAFSLSQAVAVFVLIFVLYEVLVVSIKKGSACLLMCPLCFVHRPI